jgi:hypothetical protein
MHERGFEQDYDSKIVENAIDA